MAAPLTIEWFGCTTFRVQVAGRTLWFDTYLDKAPGVPEVGLTAAQVGEADFAFVSHAHFDHLLGADTIALGTGGTIVGSYETARILRDNGVPDAQVLPVSGGEPVVITDDVTVRVLPSLHSCLFSTSTATDSHTECLGDLGVSAQDRKAAVDAIWQLIPNASPELAAWFAAIDVRCSHHDGGQLAYLLDTPDGSILVSASSGYWPGIMADLRPDVAVLALAGRPNVAGEPFQGSIASFLLGQVELVKPERVVLCHHDALLPPLLPALDVEHALQTLAREASNATHVDLPVAEPVAILGT